MKEILIIFFLLLTYGSAFSFFNEWCAFKVDHNKSYDDQNEDEYRRVLFLQNKKKVEEHNEKYKQGLVSYLMKLNKFSDLSVEEFNTIMNKYNNSGVSQREMESRLAYKPPTTIRLPESVDWREEGAVTVVKDQGSCGACWAFSATGALEGQIFRKTKKLIPLSVQNLIDCSTEYGNQGCNGGLMNNAFDYIKDHGIENDTTYPYEAKECECRSQGRKDENSVKAIVDIPQGSEEALKTALATIGPISVAIDASLHSFQFYSTGIYFDKKCSSENLNHAVLLVSYGTENGQDYWLIKNSWGKTWGEEGYVKIARNRHNHCGVASLASYPII